MRERAGSVLVTSPDGVATELPSGRTLDFGRSARNDLPLPGDPYLSRLAGRIASTEEGCLISNLSTKHTLYVLADSERVPLVPSLDGVTGYGFLLTAGAVRIGTAEMLRKDRSITVGLPGAVTVPAAYRTLSSTGVPISLNPATMEFTVALLLCRPWLIDTSQVAALPEAAEIGRQALEVTSAHHLLRDYDTSKIRATYAQRVNDHLKEIRKKVREAGILPRGERSTNTSLARILIQYDVITRRHLALLEDPDWRTRQENRWWGEPEA